MLTGIFVKSCYDLSKPENSESGDSWFGARRSSFLRKREVVSPALARRELED